MTENAIGIQEYLESYVPGKVAKRLGEKPVPDMDGTEFTLQLTIAGEKELVYGISIKDAKEITVTPGGIDNPVLEVKVSDEFIRPIVDMASSLTGKKQYDSVSQAKGTVVFDIDMPGDWTLPVSATFNGAAEPSLKISGSSADLAKIASGELNGPMAFMQGKIRMEGDMSFGISLANLMPASS
jgi:predicted lipid carrier protein YhbT